ncbi:MAG: hypothetical protein GXP30_00595 [Verrucomicrobia bacterium]|nr:hypothetical protein [Verrucomicrobiota bacterium]
MSELSSKNFIDYKNMSDFFSDKPVYDIDYMADEVFRNRHPINVKNVLDSPIDFYFPMYNIDLSRIELFSNRTTEQLKFEPGTSCTINSIEQYDVYDLIRAANAAQFVYDKPVKIGDYHYMDAAAWCPYLIDVPGIKGSKKIVIVTKSDNSFRRRLTYLFMGFVFPFLIGPFRSRHLPWHSYFQYGKKPWLIDRMSKEADVLHKYDSLITIKPRIKLGGQTDNSPETLRKNFMHGYDLIDEMEEEFIRFFKQ